MSEVRALSDEQAGLEMNKLIDFIRHEALEKSQEIKLKADEDFNIEKAKIVREESVKLEESFEKEVKQSQVHKQIAQSKFTNASRLAVLKRQQELLDNVFEEAERILAERINDAETYKMFIETLCLEGLEKLGLTDGEHVRVLVRNHHVSAAKDAVSKAVRRYLSSVEGAKLNVEVADNEYLPDSSIGGVRLTTLEGRISVTNTIQERLSLCQEKALPAVRTHLFGPSPNRKFYN
ncbi:V-ATPase V1 sector subunit E [Spiromyces aspiralis]|uniref:V-ATPase V1 sector subunit E n=1 Tax=Spiromyces aspiralis TaxID=68401 RepID=A0ACC1HJ09_9FUNG|nr:V-ATPase V1 sector subunit E [Spiromyces aspiralis]